MRFNIKVATFILASFAVAELFKTATIIAMPNIKPSSTFNNIKQQSFFSDFSVAINGKSENSINGVTLNAVFITNDKESFIFLYDGTKQILLDVGSDYNGYKLTELYPDKAIFTKDNSKYTIPLEKPNTTNVQNISKQNANQIFSNANELIEAIDVTQSDNGVKITRIKSGTIFDKMGLLKDDIIQTINDTKITSVANLTAVVQNLQNEHEIKIKVMRNNQEKELNYALK